MTYFQWLCDEICAEGMDHSYLILCRKLFETPFQVIVPNDDNRVGDAKELRIEYMDDMGPVSSLECPVEANCLELLVALARRMDFVINDMSGSDGVPSCFWEMIENLGLGDCTDEAYEGYLSDRKMSMAITRWVQRRIGFNGKHGLFPLRVSNGVDQRREELWYQMMAYLIENY